jgi:hypothetical protein
MREPKLTKVQKSTSIINLVNSWVQQAYSDLVAAESDLAAQQVRVEMEKARYDADEFGYMYGQIPNADYQRENAAEARQELERRQEIYAFAVEKFLKDENEL